MFEWWRKEFQKNLVGVECEKHRVKQMLNIKAIIIKRHLSTLAMSKIQLSA